MKGVITGQEYCRHGQHFVPIGTVRLTKVGNLHKRMCDQCGRDEKAKAEAKLSGLIDELGNF